MTEPKWYDIVAWPHKGYTLENLKEKFDQIAERYVIGHEHATTTGREHFQCRVVLRTGKTKENMYNEFPACDVTPTHVRDFKYCEKEGNYYRSWEKAINQWADIELKEWQKDLLKKMHAETERTIIVVVDPDGGKGKTYYAKYCTATRQATYVPPLERAEDLMAFAMAKPSKAYIFDMPRAEDVKKAKGLWSAVEQIKNGYLYDKRYNFRDMWIDPPQIVVFANEFPDLNALSRDRWELYRFGTIGGTRDCIYKHEVSQ